MSEQPSDMPETTDLGYRVRQALGEDPRTRDFAIQVANLNGIITLSGGVDSLQTSKAAEEIARQQEGVVSVINQLES